MVQPRVRPLELGAVFYTSVSDLAPSGYRSGRRAYDSKTGSDSANGGASSKISSGYEARLTELVGLELAHPDSVWVDNKIPKDGYGTTYRPDVN